MRKKFTALHPLLGKAANPLPISYQQRSVYYWWWAYLRRNEDYLKCCAAGGKGPLNGLYKDFGDIRSDDFRNWWMAKGGELFGEAPLPTTMARLHSKDDWQEVWTPDAVMVVSVPLAVGRRDLKRMFAKLLTVHHKARAGRKAVEHTGSGKKKVVSTAKYPLAGYFTIKSLKETLAVYDACVAADKLPKSKRPARWEIGEDLRLVQSAITRSGETDAVLTDKRNVMTAAVGRSLRKARLLIANTAKGEFPSYAAS